MIYEQHEGDNGFDMFMKKYEYYLYLCLSKKYRELSIKEEETIKKFEEEQKRIWDKYNEMCKFYNMEGINYETNSNDQ